jgi:alpha-D-xyloside xylohydrolase
MRQIFAPMAARLIDKLYRDTGKRSYGLIRAANAGMQSIPLCIYNDCYDFSQYMTGLASSGFAGTLWCPEMRTAKTAEEWIRRFQMAILAPMMQLNGWDSGSKPWLFPEALDPIRDAVTLRSTLLPYLYTAFADYRFTGMPPFRPLCMDFAGVQERRERGARDGTETPYEEDLLLEITDQYLCGAALMAAPAFTGQRQRKVVLPPGVWYDYYSGTAFPGGQSITVDCPLERLPLFVRGAVIPTLLGGKLVVRCYGDAGSGEWYDDDGETYAYEQGAYYRAALSFTRDKDQALGTVKPLHEGYKPAYEITFILI